MFNIEKAHYILDEMVMNGCIVETNKALILGNFIFENVCANHYFP